MRPRLTWILGFLTALALIWAAVRGAWRGGQDFDVFRHAGSLVLEGRWDVLYSDGPDRYLYAPGFSVLFAPFAALPRFVALAVWQSATLGVLGLALARLARSYGALPVILATVFSYRALAIDFRYGQLNIWILAVAIWALSEWTRKVLRPRLLMLSWFFLALLAVAKVYPIALFLFPAAALLRGSFERRRGAVWVGVVSVVAGLVLLGLPYLFHHDPAGRLESAWLDALSRKGLPTDTHNQSFLAFLVRGFSGETFTSLRLGEPLHGFFRSGDGLSIEILKGIWAVFFIGLAVWFSRTAWNAESSKRNSRSLVFLGLGLAFLPGHLVWKSYFLLGLPWLAAVFSGLDLSPPSVARRRAIGLYLFLALSVLGAGLLPPYASAWLEAGSLFLWVHLAVLVTGADWASRSEAVRG